jgi:hypothetical protein
MKLKLDLNDLAEDFFEDTALLGIVAPMKDYQFCWQLNHTLQFDFRINNELEIQLLKKDRKYYFAIYEYQVPHCSLSHFLYNNQFDGEPLLPEFKHLDYVWLMKGDTVTSTQLTELISGIRQINGVQLVTELNCEQIRNKKNLIF